MNVTYVWKSAIDMLSECCKSKLLNILNIKLKRKEMPFTVRWMLLGMCWIASWRSNSPLNESFDANNCRASSSIKAHTYDINRARSISFTAFNRSWTALRFLLSSWNFDCIFSKSNMPEVLFFFPTAPLRICFKTRHGIHTGCPKKKTTHCLILCKVKPIKAISIK